MAGKALAVLLLLFGGGATMYILYKVCLSVLKPVVQKKLEQKMKKDRLNLLQNNLNLHQQQDPAPLKNTQKKT